MKKLLLFLLEIKIILIKQIYKEKLKWQKLRSTTNQHAQQAERA